MNTSIRVSAAILMRGRTVLLQQRPSTGIYPDALQFPGGEAKPRETNLDALRREALEEIGIHVTREHLLSISTHNLVSNAQTVISFYIVEHFHGEIVAREGQTLLWADIDNLDLRLISPTALAIEQLKRAAPGAGTWDDVWMNPTPEFAVQSVRASRCRTKLDAFEDLGLTLNATSLVADVGCGTGDLSLELWRRYGVGEFYCIDSSLVALRALQERRSLGEPINIVHAHATRVPITNEFFTDLFLFGLLEHLRVPTEAIIEAHRLLRPGGHLYIVHSNLRSIFTVARVARQLVGTWPYGYQRNFSTMFLLEALTPYFNVEASKILLHDRDAGTLGVCDSFLNRLIPLWGRRLLIKARKRE